jgi:acetyl-CoA carboxylase biotin carboxylase subunit
MRMRRALEATVIEGIKTTVPLHQRIMEDPEFQSGEYSTKFMERFAARAGGAGGARKIASA